MKKAMKQRNSWRFLAGAALAVCVPALASMDFNQTNTYTTVQSYSGGIFTVGNTGTNNLTTVNSGGVLTNISNAYIGNFSGSQYNSLVVQGTGVVWVKTNFYVGNQGASNLLKIASGGQVFDTVGFIGSNSAAIGNVALVSGAGSVWSNSASFYVGESGAGNTLTITNGGKVFNSMGNMGYEAAGSNNTVTVAGSGSAWINSAILTVGNSGPGCLLTISEGGSVFVALGSKIGGGGQSNRVVVTGAGSIWTNASSVTVGDWGPGNTLSILNGAQVVDTSATIGNFSGNNSALVSDAGSVWQNGSGTLNIGGQSTSNGLTIANGGKVYSGVSYVGQTGGSLHWAVITGAGSLWSNTTLYVGGGAAKQCSMLITNGGRVESSSSVLGPTANSRNNTVTVTGTGSVWEVNGDVVVGGSCMSNVLNIADGGRVSSATGVILGSSASSTNNQLAVTGGTLLVTNGNGSGTLNLQRGTMTFDGGTIRADNFVASSTLAQINFFGGNLSCSNALISCGAPLTVGNGTNAASYTMLGGSHIFADGLVISSNASLRGAGYANTVSLNAGGILAPSNSPVALICNSLTLSAGAGVSHVIASTNNFSTLVSTNLTVGGTVCWSLTLLGDVLPEGASMKLFDIGSYGAGETTGWLSLGGTNQLAEGETFSVADTNLTLQTFQISYTGGDGNDVTLSVVSIPEPASLLVLLGGAGALLLRRSFRRARGG